MIDEKMEEDLMDMKIETKVEKKIFVDVENFETCSIEKHRENLIRLGICSYIDLEGKQCYRLDKEGKTNFDSIVEIISWNPAQSKFLVEDKDEEQLQYMCNPFSIIRRETILYS